MSTVRVEIETVQIRLELVVSLCHGSLSPRVLAMNNAQRNASRPRTPTRLVSVTATVKRYALDFVGHLGVCRNWARRRRARRWRARRVARRCCSHCRRPSARPSTLPSRSSQDSPWRFPASTLAARASGAPSGRALVSSVSRFVDHHTLRRLGPRLPHWWQRTSFRFLTHGPPQLRRRHSDSDCVCVTRITPPIVTLTNSRSMKGDAYMHTLHNAIFVITS